MKNIKHILIVPFLFIFIHANLSCTEEAEIDVQDVDNTDKNNQIKEDKSKKELISLQDIYDQLEPANFPQEWNEKGLNNTYKTVSVSAEKFKKINLIKSDYNKEPVLFYWKYEASDWNLICLGIGKSEKSYYLVSLNKDYKKIDELYIAGTEWISTDGGISMTEMKISSVIEKGTGPVKTDNMGKKEEYLINSEGKFIKQDSSIPLTEFKNLFEEYSSMPYEADSIFVSEVNESGYSELKADHISTLFKKGEEIADIHGKSAVEEFISTSTVSHSKAHALHTFSIDKGVIAYTWSIEKNTDYHSYKELFISFVENNEIKSSYALGYLSSSSDSPMWVEEIITAQVFFNGDIKIEKKFIEGDSDTGGEWVSITKYKYSLKNNVLVGGELSD